MYSKVALLGLALAGSSAAQISDGFEEGWNQAVWPIYAPDCNQGGTVSLDTTVAHTGKNSMKVTSPGGYCGHIFFGNNASIPTGGDIYVRTWLKATNALTSNHVSFIVMPDPSLGTNEHLRIGGQDQVLMYNRESDDATLPDMSPQGTATSEALPAGSWQCFEYHVDSTGLIETWLNGEAIAGMTVGPGVSNPNANGWGSAYKPKIDGVYFGWESYGGDVNTFWYDDVAIESSRVGCAVAGTTGGSSSPSSTAVSPPAKSTTAAGKTSTLITTTSAVAPAASGTVPQYAQCGGQGWKGATVCIAPYTCKVVNDYYSQCQ